MKHVKLLVASLLMALPLQGFAEEGVRLLLKDGRKGEYALSRHPQLVSGDTSVTLLVADGEKRTFPLESVQRLTFCDVSTGIAAVKGSSDISVRTTADGVHVSGLPAHDIVYIFSVDGKVVASGCAGNACSDISLRLPTTAPAIYILQTKSGYSLKFVKR